MRPFTGYTVDPKIAEKLLAPPYDVVDVAEAKAAAGTNEYSFFRVSRAEVELDDKIDPYDAKVYQHSADNLQMFMKNKWIAPDPKPILYVYAQRMGTKIQFGIMAACSLIEYEKNIIKKHEFTREKKVIDRTKVIEHQNAHSEPVFFTYNKVEEVDHIVNDVCTRKPYFIFVADDGVEHIMWKMTEGESNDISKHFKTSVKELYIADGHHRVEASYRFYQKQRAEQEKAGKPFTGEETYAYVMALLFPDNQVHIWDYNRVIKTLNGKTPQQILEELKKSFIVHGELQGNVKPKKKGHYSFLIDSKWYDVEIKPELVDQKEPLHSLDSELLTQHCLIPIFGIKDIRSDENIDFVGGIRGMKELEIRCQKDCKVGIACYPCDLKEVMRIADAGLSMPPKSTWFEPKPRSGGIIHMFDDTTKVGPKL